MSSLMSGYIDRSGNFAITPTLRRAGAFEGGIANVVPYGGWDFGFMLTDGSWLIGPELKFHDGWSDGIGAYNVGGQRNDRGRIEGGKWGWVGDGRALVQPQFDDIGRYKQELIAVRVGEQWGYADKLGNLRIAPAFEYAGQFSKGLAVASVGGKDGYLKPDGTWFLEPQYEQLGPYCPSRGRMKAGNQWFLVDNQGNALSEGYENMYPLVEGMARVQRGEKITFINGDGAPITGEWFDDAKAYDDGLAAVRRGDDWFLLGADGRLHGPYAQAFPPQLGLARFVVSGEGVGYMRNDGAVVVPANYQDALGFVDGLAAVCRDDKWTFIDSSGQELHAPHWESTMSFSEGLAAVRQGGKWGLVDETGQLAVAPAFDSIEAFSGGLAAARRVSWPSQVSVPDPSWYCTPREGLTFRGFENCTAQDEVRITVCFSETPDAERSLKMQQIVGNWREMLEFNNERRNVIKNNSLWIADYAISLRLTGVQDPVPALDLLLAELKAIGLPIKEVTFGRFRKDPTLPMPLQITLPKQTAVPHPDDPLGETFFSNFEEYAAIAFDPNRPQPRSESLQHLLAGRWNSRTSEMANDERIFSLHLPDIRVCYGATQEGTVGPDARSQEVAQAVTDAFATTFDPARMWVFPGNKDWRIPAPMVRDGSPGVEKIEMMGRIGYSFGVECMDLLQDVGPDVFRYREPEMMEALGEVIRNLGLLPTLMWQRFGEIDPNCPSFPGAAHPARPTVYVVNLWER